eukprot:1601085-Pleurochrysis_carterae.AAC.2
MISASCSLLQRWKRSVRADFAVRPSPLPPHASLLCNAATFVFANKHTEAPVRRDAMQIVGYLAGEAASGPHNELDAEGLAPLEVDVNLLAELHRLDVSTRRQLRQTQTRYARADRMLERGGRANSGAAR